MATVFELQVFDALAPLFVFLLVFAILYALLEKIQFFGKNHFANIVISFCSAVLFILIPEMTEFITIITPMFIVFFIGLIFIVLSFMFMGVKSETIADVFGGGKYMFVFWVMIFIALGIFGFAFTQIYGDQIKSITAEDVPEGEEDLVNSVGQIIFNPRVLSMLLLLVIAGFAVRNISQSQLQVR